jgi:hypothetical protein
VARAWFSTSSIFIRPSFENKNGFSPYHVFFILYKQNMHSPGKVKGKMAERLNLIVTNYD